MNEVLSTVIGIEYRNFKDRIRLTKDIEREYPKCTIANDHINRLLIVTILREEI